MCNLDHQTHLNQGKRTQGQHLRLHDIIKYAMTLEGSFHSFSS